MKGSFIADDSSDVGEFTISLTGFNPLERDSASIGVYKDVFGCRGDVYITEEGVAFKGVLVSHLDGAYDFSAVAREGNDAQCATDASATATIKDLALTGSVVDSNDVEYSLSASIGNIDEKILGVLGEVGSFDGRVLALQDAAFGGGYTYSMGEFGNMFNCEGRWSLTEQP